MPLTIEQVLSETGGGRVEPQERCALCQTTDTYKQGKFVICKRTRCGFRKKTDD